MILFTMNELNQSCSYGRLYLEKGENEIYVNNCIILKQHQIDGVRFLFTQFKKKLPGVILNYPPGCGKSTAVLLFLNAISFLLKNPVLILCNCQTEISYWKDLISKWTQYTSDDIEFNSSNPYTPKKKIFIKSTDNFTSFLRRDWSIVVVKDDIIRKDILKLPFRADYKIWITSTDIKKVLSMLSQIYTWLNPKLKMKITDFDPPTTNGSLTERISKSILLDAFVEDFVIQRQINLEPFGQKNIVPKGSLINTLQKTPKTRKNKDITGTKIKRSRRKLDEDHIPPKTMNCGNEVSKQNKTNTNNTKGDDDFCVIFSKSNHKINRNNLENMETTNDSEKLDVETFIRDREPLKAQRLDLDQDLDNLSNIGNDNETKMDVDFSGHSINFGSAIRDIVKTENKISNHNNYVITDSIDFDMRLHKNGSENRNGSCNLSFTENIKNISHQQVINVDDKSAIIPENENVKNNEIIGDINENEKNIMNEIKTENVSKELQKNEVESNLICEQNRIVNELECKEKSTKNEVTRTEVLDRNEMNILNMGRGNVDINIIKTERCNEGHKDIEFKLSEMEERALKKFKGSILDNIF